MKEGMYGNEYYNSPITSGLPREGEGRGGMGECFKRKISEGKLITCLTQGCWRYAHWLMTFDMDILILRYYLIWFG